MSYYFLLFAFGQVANKLFQLSYVAETIEHFAKSMLFSAVNQNASDVEACQPGLNEQLDEGKVWNIAFSLFIALNLV